MEENGSQVQQKTQEIITHLTGLPKQEGTSYSLLMCHPEKK
jgi:hypothetical protein